MAPIRYSLHYETYSEHLMSRFGKLLQTQSLVDMTLMCSSHTLRVHKAVLSASSAYFQEVLQKQSGEPLIILKMRFSVLKCLVEFMYCGKTQCLEENMDELVSAAQFLKIKGLSKVTKEGLGITSTGELPVFTPPVVINRPPQSLIDLHSKDVGEIKSQPAQPSSISNQLVESRKKDMVVRIPFDIESGGNNVVDYADPAQFIRPKRGRPSFRRSISSGAWDSSNEFGRATERALLRREQDSRKAIHQLKHLQSRHVQDYMDRVTLSQAVSSICDSESSKHNLMNIDNDLMYMDQTMSTDVLNPSIPYTKDHTLSNKTITSSYSASSTINDTSNGDISNAMSQYVNALKNAGLPTDLPILFESGDGSYINVNEQVLLDMVQSSEIQYEVIEQPNLMEKVSDPSEIKSIDDLSKSIERGEMLMNSKNFSESSNFNKDAINSLNEILPDNLDSFSEQQNFVVLNNTNNNSSMDNDNTHDFSCIDNDLQFFTKSMSEDVKKYYEEQQLNDAREMEEFCPTSASLDTNFNMTLLDTKSTHLNDPITDAYSTLNAPDLIRNEDFDFESQLPNPNDYKDETLEYLISTPKQRKCETNYDDEKQAQETDEIIKDLMDIESKINTKEETDITQITPNDKAYQNLLNKPITSEIDQIKDSDSKKENVNSLNTSLRANTGDNSESSYKDSVCTINEVLPSKLLASTFSESTNGEDTLELQCKNNIINKTNIKTMELKKDEVIKEKDDMSTSPSENIPFAVGLLPLKQVQTKEAVCDLKRKNQVIDFINNVDAKCLKRKKKFKKK